ncbi:hypothetical protein BDV18DRAFT_146147 [Aspergillus unguis]
MVDRSAAVRGVAAAFLTLASIAVILRCYVRVRIIKGFGWDDWVMLLAMLFYVMFCGCMIGGSLWGTGKHLSELTPKQRSLAMEYWFLCDIAYTVSSILAKISVCIFLLRVMLSAYHRTVLYVATALAVSAAIPFFVLLIIQCSPVSFFWTRMEGDIDGKCGRLDAVSIMLYIFSVTSALFDLTVGLLPILLVQKLQMTRTKFAVAGLLGLACIASIAIIVRIPYVPTIKNPDFLYATVEIAIWSCVETGLSITAGSLATIRPLFRVFFSHASSKSNPFTNTNDPSTPNNKRRQSRSKSESRRISARNILALDSGLGGFNFGFGQSTASNHTRSRNRTPTFSNRSRSRPSTSFDRDRPINDFYEPYIGAQMLTMRSRVDVEGGIPDGFENSRPQNADGDYVLNMILPRSNEPGNRSVEGDGWTEDDIGAPEQAARSGSGIGVHRTFEVSSSSTINEGGGTGS